MQNLVGKYLSRYHILEQLGEGGMATVYKAFDTRLERQVAIKVIRREAFGEEIFSQVLVRFEREAKALAKLSHPNIVRVHDFGEHEGSPYLVMEYVPGGTLKQFTGKPMPWREAVRLLLPIARALHYAHGMKIIHRDIKPANILITASGEPMLSDFGIAKILASGEGMTLTGTGVGIGTPEYMAPEQGMGTGVDARSDVYALGVVLYELVTGRRPYEADTPLAVLLKHVTDPLPRPKLFVRDLPDELEWVLLKALAKMPEDRYPDMASFVEALEKVLKLEAPTLRQDVVVKPKPPEPVVKPAVSIPSARPMPSAKPKTWLWLALGLGGMSLICVLGLVGFGVLRNLRQERASQTAVALATVSSKETSVSGLIEATLTVSLPTETLAIPTQVPPTVTQELLIVSPEPTLPEAFGPGINPTDQAELIYIPAGAFNMGISPAQAKYLLSLCPNCNEENFIDSIPVHTVRLDSYYIYKTEVSNAMYARCVLEGFCSPPRKNSSEGRTNYYGNPTYDNYPVVYVTWYAAQQYCQWAGGRLPTEAEWEYAARGNTEWLYPWGDQAPDKNLANVDNLIGDTTPVDGYPQGASPFGLLNMTGNVWEWVLDWYQKDYYSSLAEWLNPQGPSLAPSPPRKVGRGGAYWINLGMSSVAFRDWYEPDKDGSAVGFRCVLKKMP